MTPKQILREQLELLHKRSQNCSECDELVRLTEQMIGIAKILNPAPKSQQGDVAFYPCMVHLSTSDMEALLQSKRGLSDSSPTAVLQWYKDRGFQLIQSTVSPQPNQSQ